MIGSGKTKAYTSSLMSNTPSDAPASPSPKAPAFPNTLHLDPAKRDEARAKLAEYLGKHERIVAAIAAKETPREQLAQLQVNRVTAMTRASVLKTMLDNGSLKVNGALSSMLKAGVPDTIARKALQKGFQFHKEPEADVSLADGSDPLKILNDDSPLRTDVAPEPSHEASDNGTLDEVSPEIPTEDEGEPVDAASLTVGVSDLEKLGHAAESADTGDGSRVVEAALQEELGDGVRATQNNGTIIITPNANAAGKWFWQRWAAAWKNKGANKAKPATAVIQKEGKSKYDEELMKKKTRHVYPTTPAGNGVHAPDTTPVALEPEPEGPSKIVKPAVTGPRFGKPLLETLDPKDRAALEGTGRRKS